MAGLFSDIKNKALNAALNIADTFTPILKESKFRETGLLTPDEFVAAGDFLTGHCPTWQWASGKVFKDYLPKDKQFLITKNVPCSKRCSHLMVKEDLEKVIETESGDGGWVDTHFYDSKEEGAAAANISANQVHEIGNDESVGKNVEYTKTDNNDDDEDDDEEAVDMDAYDHNVMDDDETTVVKPVTKEAKSEKYKMEEDTEDRFIPTRTYDLNITYDNYYRTPRLWLVGYDENNKPLTIDQMYDDISEDHAKKTVTFETHPHVPGTPMASIHPCKHAEVMKKLINLMADSNKELEVYSYLMVFLKFVQSVIPTIEYDYTRNISI